MSDSGAFIVNRVGLEGIVYPGTEIGIVNEGRTGDAGAADDERGVWPRQTSFLMQALSSIFAATERAASSMEGSTSNQKRFSGLL